MRQLDLLHVLALNLWLVFAFVCGRVVHNLSRSTAAGWGVGLLVAVAPYVNVLPSWWNYRQAMQRDGGVQLENALVFDSLLVGVPSTGRDPMQRCLFSMFCSAAFDGRLAAAEIPEPEGAAPDARYVRLFVSRAGDRRCEELAEYSAMGGKNEFWTLAQGECFAVERVALPRSRYEVSLGGREHEVGWVSSPLFSQTVQVRERESGRLVASSRNYSAHPTPFWSALPSIQFDGKVPTLTLERLRAGPAR